MFKSLYFKIVLILLVFIMAVMCVVSIVLLNSVKSKENTAVTIPVKYSSAKIYNPIDGSECDFSAGGKIALDEYAGKFVIVKF